VREEKLNEYGERLS
jgi:hypothetical protein